jgi:hypothetical protein
MPLIRRPCIIIPILYLAFGIIWISSTDAFVHALSSNPEVILRFQNYKGWLFVAISSALIFILIRIYERFANAAQKKKDDVFHKTVEGSCHIILNCINQMKLLQLEAENHREFDAQVLKDVESLGEDTIKLLRELDELDIIETEHIEAVIYRDQR